LAAQGYSSRAESVSEKPEVADAHERFGQHMQEEAAQELAGAEFHLTVLAAVGIVFPAKGDVLSIKCQQAMIGNGHAMGVAAQVG